LAEKPGRTTALKKTVKEKGEYYYGISYGNRFLMVGGM
jgi:hypothetical protein